MHHIKVQQFLHGVLYVLNSRIAELYYPVAIGADEVIVLLIPIGLFVLSEVLPKLMFAHQITFDQEIECIVHGGATYPVVFVLHTNVEGFYIEMPIA